MRILHIGAGAWSRQVHGPALHRLSEQGAVSLEAICDLRSENAEDFKTRFGYQHASSDLDRALRHSLPDAVICTVHPAATAALVHRLLPLNLPLFIEKPPGISLQEALSLVAAAQSTNAQTFVAFNRRAIPSLLRLKQWTATHPVRTARAEMLRTHRMETHFAIETGIHMLDALRFLLGDPTAIEVRRRTYAGTDVSDSEVRLLFPSGAEADASLLLHAGIKRETYRLTAIGSTAEAALGEAYNADATFRGDRFWEGETITQQHALVGDNLVDDGILGEYEEFLRMVNTGVPSTCSLRDAAFSMQLAEAVQNGYSGPLPPLAL